MDRCDEKGQRVTANLLVDTLPLSHFGISLNCWGKIPKGGCDDPQQTVEQSALVGWRHWVVSGGICRATGCRAGVLSRRPSAGPELRLYRLRLPRLRLRLSALWWILCLARRRPRLRPWHGWWLQPWCRFHPRRRLRSRHGRRLPWRRLRRRWAPLELSSPRPRASILSSCMGVGREGLFTTAQIDGCHEYNL